MKLTFSPDSQGRETPYDATEQSNIHSHNNEIHAGIFNLVQAPTLPVPQTTVAPRCPLPSSNFVGRDEELGQITRFFGPGSFIIDQQKVFLVIGIGGCGKTQLVRKFMDNVYLLYEHELSSIFYIDATTAATIRAGLASIAKANGYAESSDAALAWMSTLKKPFFIYFDNADDPTMNLRDYFPRSNRARIVITTRLRDAKQNYGTGLDSAIFLGELSRVEARALLLRAAGIAEDGAAEEAVTTMIQELYGHALALVQAGAAISKNQWTVEEYLERYLLLRTELMDGKRDRVESKAMDDYTFHIRTTWTLSFARLSPSTQQLLGICAHLHHAGITEELFRRAYHAFSYDKDYDLRQPPIAFEAQEVLARDFLASFETSDGYWDHNFRGCIQEACAFSLVSFDIHTRTYSIHPLVHDFLRSVAPHPSQAAFCLAASALPIYNDQVASLPLVPHVQRLLLNWTDWRSSRPCLHPLLARYLGQVLSNAGMPNKAEPLERAALDGFAQKLGEGDRRVSVLKSNCAVTLCEVGRYHEAEELLRQVLDDWSKRLGPDHPDTISALFNLAWTLRRAGRYEEAERYHRDILKKTLAEYGRWHVETLRATHELAVTLCHLLNEYLSTSSVD